MEENRGFTIKDLLIRLILIIIFIFLLIWLFPMPDLKPLNNQIFADNIDRMRNVAKTYYTVERLPKDINQSKKMTLREMIDNKLILPLMDSNGKYCSEDDSYVEITKLENEYIIKVNLSCTDKKDYIIEHYGCYDICSDTCKMLETTSKSGYAGDLKPTGKITTKNNGKIYEYQYVKNDCKEVFDKYVCPSGYYSVGDSCIKNGSKVESNPAEEKITNIISTETKKAEVVIDSSTELKPAECKTEEKITTSTINAGYKKTTYSAGETIKTQKVTANKVYSYDVKAAIQSTIKRTASYTIIKNYDVISADKYASGYKWEYVLTKTSPDPNLAYENENEKMVFVKSWLEPCDDECSSDIDGGVCLVYQYYKYKKVLTGISYSCKAYPGYSLYDGNKCRKELPPTKKCPSGYKDNGSECVKYEYDYNCSKYGSDYKLSADKKTCTKTITKYNCDGIGEPTSDPKYCSKKVIEYWCPAGTEMVNGNKCVKKHDYYCPANTSNKTYTLNGTKCTVKTKTNVEVCSCSKYPGSVPTEDKRQCAITNSSTRYSCDKYPGFILKGDKCVKTTITPKVTYSCDKYPGSILDGKNCVKTVCSIDMKKAEKTYKKVCEQKYKWSTSTSLEGWTYTGNKRLVK